MQQETEDRPARRDRARKHREIQCHFPCLRPSSQESGILFTNDKTTRQTAGSLHRGCNRSRLDIGRCRGAIAADSGGTHLILTYGTIYVKYIAMKTYFRKHLIEKSFTACMLAGMIMLLAAPPVTAEENWKDSFNEICGKVQGAESMSNQEIKAMMDRADKLVPMIKSSNEPGKKVFLLRLKRCRGVYEFMLDTRTQ